MHTPDRRPLRVLACCGDMSVVYGLERMTFEVLRVLREHGAPVHCILNTWEDGRILAMAREIGATTSTGYYWHGFGRHLLNPIRLVQFVWDALMTSAGLLRDAWKFRPTHVLTPGFTTVLRNAPALLLLRALGVRVILRVANHPEPTRFHHLLWSQVISRLVDRVLAISVFCRTRLAAAGVPDRKLGLALNRLATRHTDAGVDGDVIDLVRARRTILVVGQVAPFKGTHLAVEAAIRLLSQGTDAQLVIVGRVPDWPAAFVAYVDAMRARVAESGFGDRIHFVGDRQNVPGIMAAAYTAAAPILQEETFGNVGLESTGAGLPPVIFPTGGLVESVSHLRTGFICRDSSLESLVEGLRYMLDHPAARAEMSAAALAWHRSPDFPFSAEAFRRTWLDVFDAGPAR
ncbi:MAG: glycosyltransferase family 4 protein [Vicinamibacterales bacterium]